ncbi:RNA polymerase sigma factor, sigma-70 family [Planctopirus limnophila DSM 3776]|uniref:RNA polymerase sigma factor, sigma-70 family n=2 Tax=Planctopirus limnophila TaxID=120 RepID=D5SWN0_PLAL2|nr:RNA polymerase sigma factor, sigma-70 family [Planctopirus limnophila DSM 3776]
MEMNSPPEPDRMNDVPAEDEQQLIERLRGGEREAFEMFVRRYCNPMYYVARRILRHDDDAREAMQEAFLSAFRKIHQFDARSQFSTWLHRIVVNAALKKLQVRERREKRTIDAFLPTFTDDDHHRIEPRCPILSSEELAQRNELRELLHQKINELPEIYRTVLLLRDIEGLDTEETAQSLQTTTDVVKTRLHRARQALRTLLEPWFSGDQL